MHKIMNSELQNAKKLKLLNKLFQSKKLQTKSFQQSNQAIKTMHQMSMSMSMSNQTTFFLK